MRKLRTCGIKLRGGKKEAARMPPEWPAQCAAVVVVDDIVMRFEMLNTVTTMNTFANVLGVITIIIIAFYRIVQRQKRLV